jgi:hypothetical protein
MKKLLTLFSLLAFSAGVFSQENELKNFRFGLKAMPSINWFKPDDAKKFESAGSKIGFGWGMQMEFRLSSIICLVTGLEVDYDRGFLNYKDTAAYFYDTKEESLIPLSDTAGKTWVAYKLNNRYYRTNYVTLPLYLKMKTKEIGMMTYFGEFGLNTSFRLKTKVNDNVTQIDDKNHGTSHPTSDLTDLQMTDDMQIFKFGLHIGGGAEYNVSGSTSLLFGLSYNLGFSNVLKKDSKYLLRTDAVALKQNSVANNFALTIGILF